MKFLEKIKRNYKNLKLYSGIRSKTHAFKGPNFAEINVTNKCTNSCLVCWFYSPLMGDQVMTKEEKNKEIPWPILKKLIEDLTDLGCEQIQFSGGGEPLMYRHFMDVFSYTRSREAMCTLVTSGYLLDKKKIDTFIDEGLNQLSVSIWAGSPEIYEATHPGKKSEQYQHIIEMCSYMTSEREKRNRHKPYLQIQHCLFSTNVKDIDNMFEMAIAVKANSINFMTFIAVPNVTDHLSMSSNERHFAAERIAFWSEEIRKKGLDLVIENEQNLMRRLGESSRDDHYDTDVVNKIGCYLGWTYTRIDATGNVMPCCGAFRFSLGNINDKRFRVIWNDKPYQTFRRLAVKKGNKLEPYFKNLYCWKVCQHVPENIHMEKQNKIKQEKYGFILDLYAKLRHRN